MRYVSFDGEDTISPDDFFMAEALREAKLALAEDEIPIGAIVVCRGKIIGRGHNLTERLNDVSAHAEMQALTAAVNYIGGKYLKDCTLYVTMEPCVMCAYPIRYHGISKLVIHTPVKFFGGVSSPFALLTTKEVPPHWAAPPEIIWLADEHR